MDADTSRALLSRAIARVANRDNDALKYVYRHPSAKLFGVCLRILNDREEAEDVLILDEPTTGLDPNQILEISQLIREVGEDKTVIFSTHILPEVTALCSRVLIISRGKLVADSPVAELAAHAAGETVVRAEFEGAVDTAKLASCLTCAMWNSRPMARSCSAPRRAPMYAPPCRVWPGKKAGFCWGYGRNSRVWKRYLGNSRNSNQ